MLFKLRILIGALALLWMGHKAHAQTIEKFSLCKNVVKLNPIEPSSQFDKGARAYCWMKLKGVKPNSHIFLDWYWEGRLMHASKLDLPYASMRTYGFKTMTKNGGWKVAVRTADNQILYEQEFRAGVGVDPLNPPPAAPTAEPTPGGINIIVLNPPSKTPPVKDNRQSPPAATEEVPKKEIEIPSPAERINQYVSSPIEEASRLLLPKDYDPTVPYPLVVFMPFTGGSAGNLYSNYLWETTQQIDINSLVGEGDPNTEENQRKYQEWLSKVSPNQPFLLLLPAGSGRTADHSPEGFSNAIARYEQRIFKDVERIKQEKSIGKVYLTGYSLGGDISWALMLRNPTYFNGAVIMGSRCSYPAIDRLPILAQQGAKICFFLGSEETEVRKKGCEWAKWQVEKSGGKAQLMIGQGLGHAAVPADELPKALGFILW